MLGLSDKRATTAGTTAQATRHARKAAERARGETGAAGAAPEKTGAVGAAPAATPPKALPAHTPFGWGGGIQPPRGCGVDVGAATHSWVTR